MYLAIALVLFVRRRRALGPIVRAVVRSERVAPEPLHRPQFEH